MIKSITTAAPHSANWLRRLGALGFTFFLVKGLLWLAVPWLLHTAWIN